MDFSKNFINLKLSRLNTPFRNILFFGIIDQICLWIFIAEHFRKQLPVICSLLGNTDLWKRMLDFSISTNKLFSFYCGSFCSVFSSLPLFTVFHVVRQLTSES
jgi:hypothetical protein